jgi:hypothetical protein
VQQIQSRIVFAAWMASRDQNAILLLLNLPDLQQSREQRLSYLRLRGTDQLEHQCAGFKVFHFAG